MGDVVRDKNKTCKCVVSHCIQRDTVTQKVSHVHKDTITYGHVRKGKKHGSGSVKPVNAQSV